MSSPANPHSTTSALLPTAKTLESKLRSHNVSSGPTRQVTKLPLARGEMTAEERVWIAISRRPQVRSFILESFCFV